MHKTIHLCRYKILIKTQFLVKNIALKTIVQPKNLHACSPKCWSLYIARKAGYVCKTSGQLAFGQLLSKNFDCILLILYIFMLGLKYSKLYKHLGIDIQYIITGIRGP